ncbi:MAG TPA: hypothetical protein VHX60_18620 [Acidobacteriaceae bacterium]|nr:hypothetical protein [Acidobacteriaceae bacterium]
MKEHHANQLASDTAHSIGERPICGRIQNSELRRDIEIHRRTTAGTFARDTGVFKLWEKSDSFRRCGIAQKMFGDLLLVIAEWPIFGQSGSRFEPSETTE